MHMLRFLLTRYGRPFYKGLAVAGVIAAAVTAGASFTAYFGPVVIVVAGLLGVLAAATATLVVMVLNAALAAGLSRRFEHFVSAYDAHRRANRIADPFYEEMDLAEAAERDAADGVA